MCSFFEKCVGEVKQNFDGWLKTVEAFMKKYMCMVCGWIYDEELGCPEEGLAPGTRWEDVPVNWTCPECGAGKLDFELIEIDE